MRLLKRYPTKNWDWNLLSENPCLTIEFIEKYLDKINWYILSLNPCLNIAFIESHLDKIYWNKLSSNQFNMHSFIKKRNLKIYSNYLLEVYDIWLKFEIRKHKLIYDLCIHELHLKIRDSNR